METLYTRKKTQALDIDGLRLKKAALVLRAINHQLRQKVLQYLHLAGEACVTDLYRELHLEQSVASQHLAILRQAGLVSNRREGKQIYYSVNQIRLTEVQHFAGALLN